MKNRLRLRDVLASIGVVMCAALSLAQFSTINKQFRARDMANLKRVGQAILIYAQGNDARLPLAMGKDYAGAYTWNLFHYVPSDWPKSGGPDPLYERRRAASPTFWATSVSWYAQQEWDVSSPGLPTAKVTASQAIPSGYIQPALVSYAYVGTLNALPIDAVNQPKTMPMLWQGHGRANVLGAAYASPALVCDRSDQPCLYVPGQDGCTTQDNGRRSVVFNTVETIWVYDRTATWMTLDTAVSYRSLGARIMPNKTDQSIDPFSLYDDKGFGWNEWTDGCHAWLFRPDKS